MKIVYVLLATIHKYVKNRILQVILQIPNDFSIFKTEVIFAYLDSAAANIDPINIKIGEYTYLKC